MKHLPNLLLFLTMVAALVSFVLTLRNFDHVSDPIPECPTGLTTVYGTFQDRDGTTGLVRMCVPVTTSPTDKP